MSKSSVTYRSVGNQVPMRIRLLKAASELFSKKGYHATSLMDIARQCGVQKSTVFHHFLSKQALALAAIQDVQTHCDDKVFSRLQKKHGVSPERRAIDFITAAHEFIQERADAFLINFMAMEMVDDKTSAFNEPVQAYFSAWMDALTDILLPLHGEVGARKLALHSLFYLHGAHLMTRINRDAAGLRQVPSHLLEIWKLKP